MTPILVAAATGLFAALLGTPFAIRAAKSVSALPSPTGSTPSRFVGSAATSVRPLGSSQPASSPAWTVLSSTSATRGRFW